MADATLAPSWPVPVAPARTADVSVALDASVALLQMTARKGQADALRAAIFAAYGVELPGGPRRVDSGGVSFAGAGPEQWLAIVPDRDAREVGDALRRRTDRVASVMSQSDGRVVISVSGRKARDLLAKHVPIDLHPRAFGPLDFAITHASHIGVIVWRTDEGAFKLACYRSFAATLWDWLIHAGAEFGLHAQEAEPDVALSSRSGETPAIGVGTGAEPGP